MTEQHPDPTRRWRNRRRMAWLCTFASILFPVLTIFTDQASTIAGPFYLFTGAVVGAYIGFSTWDDK